jgi:AcrR family transcriptional regulator
MPAVARAPIRERILDAAAALFYDEGYDVTIDAIAARASVAKPTVYAHFASKDALIEAVLDASREAFFADFHAGADRAARDPIAALLSAFDLLVADLPDPAYRGCICLNAAASFPDPQHAAHRVLAELDDRLRDEFEALLRRAGARAPARLARQLVVLFDGVKARGLVDASGKPGRDARDAARTLVTLATTA